MAGGITGSGTTFDLPNYTGELFQVTPNETPLLSIIGGLTGGKEVHSTQIEWQEFDLRKRSDRQKKEGQDAPAGEGRKRSNVTNVLQIHQEAVGVSYTKQAATGQKSGLNIDAQNPVQDELGWQITQELKQIAGDVEYSFINGTYQLPTDNTKERKTRGLLQAIATNKIAAAGKLLSLEMFGNICQMAYDNGGIAEGDTATVIVNSTQKRALSWIFSKGGTQSQPDSRNYFGVNLQTIETDFGKLNIMLSRDMPADSLAVASLEHLEASFLAIPGKGHFFAEPLAKTGASDKVQVYGEIGLEYGNEKAHAKITGLSTDLSALFNPPVVPAG
ncbi:DUF5309 family protein [Arthrobacter sp. GMC3]|uniref:SU10 major capsid protein n=1 Tax=Arthrobacter sp. GMC3 TaxID=2058894 RepID=UPI000CE4C7CB|nr:DUF5309 family protein [Arthrobacter sp. GMC3]